MVNIVVQIMAFYLGRRIIVSDIMDRVHYAFIFEWMQRHGTDLVPVLSEELAQMLREESIEVGDAPRSPLPRGVLSSNDPVKDVIPGQMTRHMSDTLRTVGIETVGDVRSMCKATKGR